MSQLKHREESTRYSRVQEQLAGTEFEPACVWHQVHVCDHYRHHLTERGESGGEVNADWKFSDCKKKVNAVLQILFEISCSKAMSKISWFWTSYYLILLFSIFERKDCSKLWRIIILQYCFPELNYNWHHFEWKSSKESKGRNSKHLRKNKTYI